MLLDNWALLPPRHWGWTPSLAGLSEPYHWCWIPLLAGLSRPCHWTRRGEGTRRRTRPPSWLGPVCRRPGLVLPLATRADSFSSTRGRCSRLGWGCTLFTALAVVSLSSRPIYTFPYTVLGPSRWGFTRSHWVHWPLWLPDHCGTRCIGPAALPPSFHSHVFLLVRHCCLPNNESRCMLCGNVYFIQ